MLCKVSFTLFQTDKESHTVLCQGFCRSFVKAHLSPSFPSPPPLSLSLSPRMTDAMNEFAPGNGIEMKISDDGSGRGAAMVAAVAVRLASS